jgi:hypothetical protein
MVANRRWFDIANLQAEHAEGLLGQLSLAHSLPSGSLVEAEPCALCHVVEPKKKKVQEAPFNGYWPGHPPKGRLFLWTACPALCLFIVVTCEELYLCRSSTRFL